MLGFPERISANALLEAVNALMTRRELIDLLSTDTQL